MADVSRRGFLKVTGVGLVSVGTGTLWSGAKVVQADPGAAFVTPLRMPPVLTGDHVTLVAREALVQILPGMPTRMWTFNGSFPGPIIRRPSGRPVQVTVQHRLPASVGSLTIHHHGAHSVSSEDGQPERNVIEPGHQRTYTYGLMEDGQPERAAFQWYHDHSHHRTTTNLWHGLAGLFILDDHIDGALPLPRGRFDVPLVITERSFDSSNQLVDGFVMYDDAVAPGAGPGYAPEDDLFGTHFLVNGVEAPYLDVQPRKYRLRLLNTSPFRPYNLSLSDGGSMTQVATESGLMPTPLERTEVLFGPGERVEVVVDFRGREGSAVMLRTGPVSSPASPIPATTPGVGDLMKFRVGSRPVRDTAKVPARLRPLPPWVAQVSAVPHRVWAFGVGVDATGRTAWTVNGQAFDHNRVDAKPALGSVETWMLVNATPIGTSHYIHIHGVDWKMLSRNGAAPPIGEDALKETFRLDPGEVIVIASKFSDHLGRFMLHCHMLQHEDHGMMTNFEVVPPGQSDAPKPGLGNALKHSITDETVRAHVAKLVATAVGGRPALSLSRRGSLASVMADPHNICRAQETS